MRAYQFNSSVTYNDYNPVNAFEVMLAIHLQAQQRQARLSLFVLEFAIILIIAQTLEAESMSYRQSLCYSNRYAPQQFFVSNQNNLFSNRPVSHTKAAYRPASQVPNDFKLTPDTLENLKQGKLFDPIMQETTDIHDGEKFACVKLSNNVYHVYKQSDFEEHIKTMGVTAGKFKDINSLEPVNLCSVFTLTYEQLREFASSKQSNSVGRNYR